MSVRFSDVVSFDDPVLAGHFPGNPVVPAVVILNKLRDALKKIDSESEIIKINRVKFVEVLRPSEEFFIDITHKKNNQFTFDCRKKDETLFASGEVLTERANYVS